MKDPRYTKLADVLVRHSTQVKPGDRVLIEAYDIPADFTAELIRVIAEAGGVPLVSTYQQPVLRALYKTATEEQMKFLGEVERMRMKGVQAYIGVRGSHNITEMADVPQERMALQLRGDADVEHADPRACGPGEGVDRRAPGAEVLDHRRRYLGRPR